VGDDPRQDGIEPLGSLALCDVCLYVRVAARFARACMPSSMGGVERKTDAWVHNPRTTV
jgi:hypothetical protein